MSQVSTITKYFEICTVEEFSGEKLKFFSVFVSDTKVGLSQEGETLFEKFLQENKSIFKKEVEEIENKLSLIGQKTGLKFNWIREREGYGDDGVCCIFDYPEKELRLYFQLLEEKSDFFAMLLGGGGPKPKGVKKFQENAKLKEENFILRGIAKVIKEKIKSGELILSKEYGIESTSEDCDFIYEFTYEDPTTT